MISGHGIQKLLSMRFEILGLDVPLHKKYDVIINHMDHIMEILVMTWEAFDQFSSVYEFFGPFCSFPRQKCFLFHQHLTE